LTAALKQTKKIAVAQLVSGGKEQHADRPYEGGLIMHTAFLLTKCATSATSTRMNQ
jgi:non-homologous end joining protein Ku